MKIERGVVKDSSPGYPWNTVGAENGEVLQFNGTLIWGVVEARMNYIVNNFEEVMKMTPRKLVQSGACDVVKLFIKNEPHSQKKIQSGQLRLISSVSLADQLLTRVTSLRQNKMEIANWKTCPSKPGMGLHDEGLQAIVASAEEILEIGAIMATDLSSWDWTVQEWELVADAHRRIRLAGISREHPMAKLLLAHAHIVANSVYVDSDGNMFEQLIPGGQLSGDLNTGATNSGMRVIATQMARLKAAVEEYKKIVASRKLRVNSQGDDTFELAVAGVAAALAEMGHIVKQVDFHDSIEGLEFCSQTFRSDGTAYPTDYSKTLYRFMSHAPDDSEYASYAAQLKYTFRYLDNALLGEIEKSALARVERARKIREGSL